MSHRALVFDRGRVVAEFRPGSAVRGAADRGGFQRRGGAGGVSTAAGAPAQGSGGLALRARATRLFATWNLLILLVLLIALFGAVKGDTFLTAFTFQSMVNSALDQRAGGAGGDDPAGRQQFRLVRGLGARHFAGAGQWLADPAGPALAGCRRAVPAARCGDRIGQRRAGGARAHKLVHRHARLGHFFARRQPVVHGRTPGGRPARPRVSAHLGKARSYRHPPPDRLFAGDRGGAVDRIRLFAGRPLAVCHRRQPARGGAERAFRSRAASSSPSSPRACSRRSPAWCCRRSYRSARAPSARNSCCPPLPVRCSAPPPSGQDGRMFGAPCWRLRCSPSRSPA